MPAETFFTNFRYFTGYDPYPWQTRLFEQFVSGCIPEQLSISTGLGKTSVMLVWFLALAEHARSKNVTLPRRLVYVVNRRTVVDQATQIAEGIRAKLTAQTPEATELRRALATVCAQPDPPLAISTLRGQFADNRQWKEDPSRPAIVVGTVDMVGSRLLFAGYGDGRKRRPVHAGLLGQDSLLVHDEAHLDPAFAALLDRVREAQRRASRFSRPLQILALSATLRKPARQPLTLSPEDRNHPVAGKRLRATKRLYLHEVAPSDIYDQIAELAKRFEGSAARVLVFVRSPRDAQELASSRLRKLLGNESKSRIALLTGTMRGYERDRLLQANPVFQAFMKDSPPAQTVYLIATSAGEVGVDLDADHLVTELAPLDSLLQRLGRVNRRGGENRCAQVHVVAPTEIDEKATLGASLTATKKVLLTWYSQNDTCDLSPENVERLLNGLSPEERLAAFSPSPRLSLLTDIHLDLLAATSLEDMPPGSPQVPKLLHGVETAEPEVTVFWRQELELLAQVPEDQVRAWFDLCPPAQRELVRLPVTMFVKDFLGKLRKLTAPQGFTSRAIVFSGGRAQVTTTDALLEMGPGELAFALVALPATLGGLDPETGMVDPAFDRPVFDVADLATDGQTLQVRAVAELSAEGQWVTKTFDGSEWDPPADWELLGSVPLATDAEGQVTKSLRLYAPRPETASEEAEQVTGAVTLADHTAHVKAWCRRLADALALNHELAEALDLAAEWHDQGKQAGVWQYFARAEGAQEPLAKAERYRDSQVLAGFRHEWSSAHRFYQQHKETSSLPVRLAGHLLATHHGWGRPHFPPWTHDPAFAPAANRQLAVLVANTYAYLQHQLGWWTLAWLEAVFRAADALASRFGPPPTPTEN